MKKAVFTPFRYSSSSSYHTACIQQYWHSLERTGVTSKFRLVPQQQKDRFSKSRVGKSPWNIGLKNTGGGRPKGSKNKK